MPRSPADGKHLARYDDAWEAINQLIRQGGSWSGFERNCFYFAAGDGAFVNCSAASGLDFIDDGRALAIVDLDRDGDLDLVLKNRSGPQLRVLRNDFPRSNRSLAFFLEGTRPSNRDAIGARVTVRQGGRVAAKTVTCGHLFLSQSSRWLHFGLGKAERADAVEVRWPSGRRQAFKDVPAGRRYRLVEGDELRGEPMASPSDPAPPPAGSAAEGAGGPEQAAGAGRRELWLLAECPLPSIAVKTLDGQTLELSGLRGKAALVNFFSRRCAPCDREIREWAGREELVRKLGLKIVLLSADGADPEAVEAARIYLQERRVPFLAAAADDRALAAYGMLIHQIARWPVDFVVPTSLLIGFDGQLAKIYQGPVDWDRLVDDAVRLHQTVDRRRLALPFPGVYYSGQPPRDYFHLGLGYWERGLFDLAIGSFERGLKLRPLDADMAYNIGVLHLDQGELEPAAAAFKRAIAADADFADAYSNLGVALAQEGDFEGALEHFREAQRLRPGYSEPLLNEANVHAKRGDWEKALAIYEKVRAAEPFLADVHKRLGEVYHHRGEEPRAMESFQEALRLEPQDAEARSNLAVVLASLGKFSEARVELEQVIGGHPKHAAAHNNLGLVLQAMGEMEAAGASFRRALELKPDLAEAALNLARWLLRQGMAEEARGVLDGYLKRHPDQPAVRALREKIVDSH